MTCAVLPLLYLAAGVDSVWVVMTGSVCEAIPRSGGKPDVKVCAEASECGGGNLFAPMEPNVVEVQSALWGGRHYSDFNGTYAGFQGVDIEWFGEYEYRTDGDGKLVSDKLVRQYCEAFVNKVKCQSCTMCEYDENPSASVDCTNYEYGRKALCEPVDPLFFPIDVNKKFMGKATRPSDCLPIVKFECLCSDQRCAGRTIDQMCDLSKPGARRVKSRFIKSCARRLL